MKILLKGHYGFGNLGDDILMLVSYHLLKEVYPNSIITIFSNNSINNRKSKSGSGYNNYILDLVKEPIEIVDWTDKKRYDLIVNGGGGLYFDHSCGSFVQNLINQSILAFFSIKSINKLENTIRKLTGRRRRLKSDKKIGIGLGFGKYQKGSKALLRDLSEVAEFDYLWVRDDFSINFLKQFRYRGELKKFSDLAFLSKDWLPSISNRTYSKVERIGIVLMKLEINEFNIYNEIKEYVKRTRKTGLALTLFTFDETYDQDIEALFPEEKIIIWRPNSERLENYLKKIAKCQLIISLRAHGAILGGIMGAIPVCIESSIKLAEVAKMFPNSGHLLKANTTSEELIKCTTDIITNYSVISGALKADIKRNKLLAKEGEHDLVRYMS